MGQTAEKVVKEMSIPAMFPTLPLHIIVFLLKSLLYLTLGRIS